MVTKCPEDLSIGDREETIREINPLPGQHVFFSCIQYGQPYHLVTKSETTINNSMEVLLVTGIANPRPLKKYLQDNSKTYYQLSYNDHYIFSIDDLKEIIKRFQSIQSRNKIILTTEKDAVRLVKFQMELAGLPFYVLPIQSRILFGEAGLFQEKVTGFIKNFKKQP